MAVHRIKNADQLVEGDFFREFPDLRWQKVLEVAHYEDHGDEGKVVVTSILTGINPLTGTEINAEPLVETFDVDSTVWAQS